jgi:hypothetical protein
MGCAALLPCRDANTPIPVNASYWMSSLGSPEGTWNLGAAPETGLDEPEPRLAPPEEAAWAELAAAQLAPPSVGADGTWTFTNPEHAVQWSWVLPQVATVEVRAGDMAWRGQAREMRIVGQFQSPVQVVIPSAAKPGSIWAKAALGDGSWPWRPPLAVPRGRGDQVAIEFPMPR